MSDGGQTGREVCLLSAADQARLVRERHLSCLELVREHLQAIEEINPLVNAIVTLTPDAAIAAARRADDELSRGRSLGPLHGLPVAHKDFTPTAGVRTTFGSPLYADHVPTQDALCVERLKQAGAVSVGKTNTPEFAAGSQTYNQLFGATLNPYDRSRTCGGSSGGAAVALACGMVALADGTDLGGSLRNPASFCNVVGLRASFGRVPVWPTPAPWCPLIAHGPMARTVQDVALMMAAMAGPDDRVPVCHQESGAVYLRPLERDLRGVRVAWSRDLGGLPVQAAVTEALERERGVLDLLGCRVEEIEPDFTGADEAFTAWRAWLFELSFGALYDRDRDRLGEDVAWNIEQGRSLTGPQLARAERLHAELDHRLRGFMRDREFLLAPVVQMLPFDVEQHYPREIEGVAMSSYIDWMKSCYHVSAAGLPACSVPFGFSDGGLPVGLQVIGRHNDEWGVLQLAHAIERETQHWRRRPPIIGRGDRGGAAGR
jgi:amidase